MAETETPIVTDETLPVPTRIPSNVPLLERWVQGDGDQALKKVDTLARLLDALRERSIRQTYPGDWVIHVSYDKDGNVLRQAGYLQDSGAERAGKIWGIEVGQPIIEREDLPDGTYAYHMLAEAWSKITGERVESVEGSRWSGDTFFTRRLKDPDEKVDPSDVRKSAYANLHGRAVRSLSGLTAVPVEILKAAGLDTARCIFVGYDKGAKGGESSGAAVGTADVTVAFGRSAGKKPADLADADLAWYVKAYGENVADPAKAKFVKANQRVLDALKAEQERRAKAAEHAAATGAEAPAGDPEIGADGKPTPRGTRIANFHTRLVDALTAAGGTQQHLAPLLRIMTKDTVKAEKSKLSDLTDEELEKLAKVPDEILSTLVKVAIGGKA